MTKTLITMASWEPRFAISCEAHIASQKFNNFLVLYSNEMDSETISTRKHINSECIPHGIKYNEVPITLSDPQRSYTQVEATFSDLSHHDIVLDITTMPREIIWYCMSNIKKISNFFSFSYSQPLEYSKEWLTRSPETPRLVLKHSGITKLNKPTALVVTTGFDNERTKQLVNYYDPAETKLCYQSGEQFNSINRTMTCHEELDCDESCCQSLTIDAYSADIGFSKLEDCVQQLIPNYNVVIASLGPKPSAVTAYLLQLKYPDIALTYTPSGEINLSYSSGLRCTMSASFIFSDYQKHDLQLSSIHSCSTTS